MSTLENDRLVANAFESFIIETLDNYDFDSFIQEHYFTFSELWHTKESGCGPEEAYDRIFDELLKWDFEGSVFDIIQPAKDHVAQRKS